MQIAKFPSVLFLGLILVGSGYAQATDPSNKPAVKLENNRPKPTKDSPYRTIQGVVKDQSNNPVSGAIVRLKNDKTSKVVAFATKDDGRFSFSDLPMDNNFELTAQRGDITSPVKKVSIYDSRKDVMLNFRLEPPKSEQQ
jgi:hypothetical protein